MKKLVSTLKLEKKEWLTYRKKGIGGSDAGAVYSGSVVKTKI